MTCRPGDVQPLPSVAAFSASSQKNLDLKGALSRSGVWPYMFYIFNPFHIVSLPFPPTIFFAADLAWGVVQGRFAASKALQMWGGLGWQLSVVRARPLTILSRTGFGDGLGAVERAPEAAFLKHFGGLWTSTLRCV